MSEELLINISPMESRVAVLDNGILGEIYIERHHKLGLVGNIYLGTVVRVLPGMQAAFVDIGQSRQHFYTLTTCSVSRVQHQKKKHSDRYKINKIFIGMAKAIDDSADHMAVTSPVVSTQSTEVIPVAKR